MIRRGAFILFSGLLVCSFFSMLLTGCSADSYRRQADKAVYTIIKNKQKTLFGETIRFSLKDYGGRPQVQSDMLHLDLRKALITAAKHSREFQRHRETLYSVALALTSARHRFAPNFLASLQATLSGDKKASTGQATGTVGMDKMWKWGLLTPVRFSTNLLRSFTADPNETARSAVSLSITQPILRGFGTRIAAENLTQAERDVIYQVRSFERYRKEFAVDITTAYLQALQRYDAVENAQMNLENVKRNYDQIQAEFTYGRVEKYQADQAETNYLSAQDGLVTAQRNLQKTLDDFKIRLGLPLEQEIVLDFAELESLKTSTFDTFGLSAYEAQEIALNCRLDYANTRDYVDDADRNVVIMKDELRTQLDLTGTVELTSEETVPGKFSSNRWTYRNAGINLDLPIDRLYERNNYRNALINLDQAKRNLEQSTDTTRLEVVDSLRDLKKAKRSFDIQQKSRALARQRVESTEELRNYGQVAVRDLLEAQQEELRAENEVTSELVNCQISYLNFLLSLGILQVDEEGHFMEFVYESETEESDAGSTDNT